LSDFSPRSGRFRFAELKSAPDGRARADALAGLQVLGMPPVVAGFAAAAAVLQVVAELRRMLAAITGDVA
jgi:hypothetical protein